MNTSSNNELYTILIFLSIGFFAIQFLVFNYKKNKKEIKAKEKLPINDSNNTIKDIQEMNEKIENIIDRLKENENRFEGLELIITEGFIKKDVDEDIDKEKQNLKNEKKKQIKKLKNLDDSLEELYSLVGLESLKKEIKLLIDVLEVNKIREKFGKKKTSQQLNSLFLGNPGTGKTTVARILGQIFRTTGVLSSGHIVEVSRVDLVSQYIGKSAILTNQKIDEAKGGILFIDEAYSLFSGNDSDFGSEVISTLIKRMEDDRGEFVVILAGYEKEMKSLLDSNTGLRSRFTHSFHFENYNKFELLEIFKIHFTDQGFYLTKEAEHKIMEIFQNKINDKNNHFGNGRFARNMFETAIKNQSKRIKKISNEREVVLDDLERIDISDF